MTNEQAINLITRISYSQHDAEKREALEMAVRALSGDGDLISRKMAIEAFEPTHYKDWYTPTIIETLETLPFVRPEVLACGNGELVKESDGLVQDLVKDCISRQQAIDAVAKWFYDVVDITESDGTATIFERLRELPSAQPEQRYTEEELRVFKHGISLSLLSKRSSQHWQYDEDTATEIKFLERLYEKVSADMRGAE